MFRKKPVVIEAFQWWGEEVEGFDRICVGRDELGISHYNLVIHTLEGDIYATEGDWIITGVRGEKYPCKPDIFELTYEPATETHRRLHVQTKKWYQSWTLWANILALVVLVANGVGFAGFVPDPWVTEIGTIIILVLNIALRYFRTSKAIEK